VALGAGGLAARLEGNPKVDPLPALHRLLDLPRDVFSRSGDRFIVTFDEFHEVLKLDGVDGILRSHIQHHGEFAGYVFAGSEPGMMDTLFARRERPLFGQAHPVELGPLSDADLGAFIAERFRASGRDAGEALDALLELADGHPQRAMMLAHYLWRETLHGATASVSTWSEALDAAVAPRAEGFDRFLDTLSTTEERVLFALALSPTGPYSTYAQQRFGLPRSSAADALRSLAGRGEVVTVDGVPRITDPLLRWWLRQRRTP
jgi:hypothetical protein